jgi:hypothetical protein
MMGISRILLDIVAPSAGKAGFASTAVDAAAASSHI